MDNQKLTFNEATDLDELLKEIKIHGYSIESNILDEISKGAKNSIYNEYNYKKLSESKLIEYEYDANTFKYIIYGKAREIDKFEGFVKLYEDEHKERNESEERKKLELSKLVKENKFLAR